MSLASPPPPTSFTARTSNVYSPPGSRPSSVWLVSLASPGALSGTSVHEVKLRIASATVSSSLQLRPVLDQVRLPNEWVASANGNESPPTWSVRSASAAAVMLLLLVARNSCPPVVRYNSSIR